MAQRLTVALEDGTVEKLRTLAGGERKTGAYLSDVVAWLWLHREALSGVDLGTLAPLPVTLQQDTDSLGARIAEVEASMSDIRSHMRNAGLLTE